MKQKKWISQLNPWHFLLGRSTFWDKKNVNQKGYVFQGYHTIQLDIIQKMWQNNIELANWA